MTYDVEAIRTKVNSIVANLKTAICSSSLYDEDDIPREKQVYQVTLKRVIAYTCQVDAYDKDDAIAQAEVEHAGRHCNYNEWDLEDALEPEVEPVEEE